VGQPLEQFTPSLALVGETDRFDLAIRNQHHLGLRSHVNTSTELDELSIPAKDFVTWKSPATRYEVNDLPDPEEWGLPLWGFGSG
jgi:hypothetical protein